MLLHIGTGAMLFVLGMLLLVMFLSAMFSDRSARAILDKSQVNLNKAQDPRVVNEVMREYLKDKAYQEQKEADNIAELDQLQS
jgi:hypothetical protein